jgi:rare lipoprotein A (peptidoglycan hydrolase)
MLRRRTRLLPAVVAALVCGAGAAGAVLLLANRGVVAKVSTHVVTDVYARLKPHPRLVEPVAGDTAGVATEVPAPTATPAPKAVEPRAGGGPPSDAEVRRQLAELRKAQQAAGQAGSVFQNPPGVGPVAPFEPAAGWHTSIASVYTDYGGPLACGGRLQPDQLGVAHKSAPCGALITFRYNGRVVRVPVIDRGPYIAGREWDLTGATARLLGFPGLDFIDWTA